MDVGAGWRIRPSSGRSSAARDVELCFESRDGPRDASFITADATVVEVCRQRKAHGLTGSVNEKQGETAVEVISAEQARTLTYAVEAWAGRLDEDMGSLHKLLSAPVQWTGRLGSCPSPLRSVSNIPEPRHGGWKEDGRLATGPVAWFQAVLRRCENCSII
jgi:hypothetical protein